MIAGVSRGNSLIKIPGASSNTELRFNTEELLICARSTCCLTRPNQHKQEIRDNVRYTLDHCVRNMIRRQAFDQGSEESCARDFCCF